jgi:hypothetical protein
LQVYSGLPGTPDDSNEPFIRVRGRSRTRFLLPTNLTNSLNHFSQFEKVFTNLPHIHPVKSGPNNTFRLQYKTLELGIYRVEIICDVQVSMVEEPNILRMIFEPISSPEPVKTRVGLHSMSGKGLYRSESIFQAHGQDTIVNFSLELEADLPCPWGLLVVPPGARNRIAHSITNYRIQEITQGFIQRSILDLERKLHSQVASPPSSTSRSS